MMASALSIVAVAKFLPQRTAMKIAVLIARILLGLLFFVFGLNGFLQFIPAPPLPGGMAGQFIDVFMHSHWVYVVCAFQLVAGVLLLIGRFVPLAIAILAPIIVNILTFHILLLPATIAPGLVAAILWIFLFYAYRKNFAALFESNPSYS
jgi:putative oxidoreductase